jgi:uncharacterized protein (UPF0335 family)
VFTEAKGNGYDVKALRTIIRLRKQVEGREYLQIVGWQHQAH